MEGRSPRGRQRREIREVCPQERRVPYENMVIDRNNLRRNTLGLHRMPST